MLFRILLFFFCATGNLYAQESTQSYQVKFTVDNAEILCLLQASSQCILLNNSPPATPGALLQRAIDDIPNLMRALQSLAYYHPTIHVDITRTTEPVHVILETAVPRIIFNIDLGPVYSFETINIESCGAHPFPLPWPSVNHNLLGITSGDPALPSAIIKTENALVHQLEYMGYPLAKIAKREVIADQKTKTITVIFHVDSGPLATFGYTQLQGNCRVLPEFFSKKIFWKEGQCYTPCAIERTVNALEASGLFSSINITHAEEVLIDNSLPMQITVQEAKQRSIGFGAGYATDLGPGVSAEWEHRNVYGLGEKISVVVNLWKIKQEGSIKYLKPDFCYPGQDLIWKADLEHEDIEAYNESSASISGTIERRLTDQLRFSYGGMFTRLRNTHSDNNRNFNLFKLPFQIMWTKTNSLLDPTHGNTIHFKTTPTLQTLSTYFAYTTHSLAVTAYHPLDSNHRFVLAGKATWGTIWGANKHSIPPSERLYAGSDLLLRGYKYMTVSPLNLDNKPIGGRSLMVYSLEARMRVFGPFGIVGFYDIGNVYSQSVPQFFHKQLQSLGIGLRYHTPVGPLRLDIAFPLNRRKHLDNAVQLYFSIGQAF